MELDPELPAALLDMKESGKTLMLITNSDWQYTNGLMSFAYNRCALRDLLCALLVGTCMGSMHDHFHTAAAWFAASSHSERPCSPWAGRMGVAAAHATQLLHCGCCARGTAAALPLLRGEDALV